MNGNAKEFPLWFADPEQIKAQIAKLGQKKHDILHAAKSALEILSKTAIFPQDIEAVRKMLSEVIKKSETV